MNSDLYKHYHFYWWCHRQHHLQLRRRHDRGSFDCQYLGSSRFESVVDGIERDYRITLTHAHYAIWYVGQQQSYATLVCSGPSSERTPMND